MSATPVIWFLRSIGDHDTHRGALRPADGTVIAACGVTFVPKVLPLGRPLSLAPRASSSRRPVGSPHRLGIEAPILAS
ncbi:MAG: hypothetical protein ABIZ05_01835 [Pseudonocardiaceae bacterium]